MSTTTDLRYPPSPPPHIALFPSAGMGHVTPFLRLAAMLASRNCRITLITAEPAVSTAETTHITAFLAAYPTINRLHFQILPYTPPNPATADPFFVQFEAIARSTHLLTPLLSSISPPLSAIFSDIATAAGVCQVADDLGIHSYIVSTSSATWTAIVAYMPYLTGPSGAISTAETTVTVPGLPPVETSSIPPPFFISNHIFTKSLLSNARALSKAKGILSNTFRAFEPETIEAVNNDKVLAFLPPFLPVGPLEAHKLEIGDRKPLPWLDQHPPESVVYISFGSRIALSVDQIREVGKGLELSGKSFLWVLKSRIVDKEDDGDVEGLVGDGFIERTKEKGMVVKGWVNQEAILSHPATGCFFSHCGWNSMMEGAARGLPVVAWPQLGDQKVNAGVVEAAGLGVWDKGWGWSGERLVKGEEIAEMVKMAMGDEKLREKARRVGKEAKAAMEVGGSSDKVLMKEMIQKLS